MIIITIILLIASYLVIQSWIFIYNELERLSGQINHSVGNLGVQLQQRMDLIPDSLQAAKSAVRAQQEYFESMLAIRKGQGSGIPEDLGGIPSSNIVLESNPNMGVDVWQEFQRTLKGTEKDVAASRRFYASAVTQFNVAIKSFPNSIVAKAHGFLLVPDFEIASSEAKAINQELLNNVIQMGQPNYNI